MITHSIPVHILRLFETFARVVNVHLDELSNRIEMGLVVEPNPIDQEPGVDVADICELWYGIDTNYQCRTSRSACLPLPDH